MSDQPHRVQLSRKKGWRMPPNTMKVDRATRWGNQHSWRDWLDAARSELHALPTAGDREAWAKEQAVQSFREDASDGLLPNLAPLRGKNLACWCPLDQPCHADVLLKLANATNHADGRGEG